MNSPPNNTRLDTLRYILAIGLSTVTLLVWYIFFSPPPKTVEENVEGPASSSSQGSAVEGEALEIETSQQVILDDTSLADSIAGGDGNADKTLPSGDGAALSSGGSGSAETEEEASATLVTLKNDFVTFVLSTENASVQEARVKNQTNEPLSDVESENFEGESRWGYPTGKLFFSASFESLEDMPALLKYKLVAQTDREVVFETELQGGLGLITVRKTYTLTETYSLELEVTFRDEAGQLVRVPYYVLNGSNIGLDQVDRSSFDIKRLSYEIGDENEEVLGSSFFGSNKTFEEISGRVDWIAVDNRFYARVLEPGADVEVDKSIFIKRGYASLGGREDFYLAGAMHVLGQGTDVFQLHFLPKNRSVLDSYYQESQAYFFNLFHQFSIMRILSSMMYWVLEQINGLLKSYGWSILVMTLLIKILTFPLTHRGMKSMYKMQQLSPKIEAIKAKYKTNNPQKMNAEMMVLYKKEQVSPLGGCLPMLVPIPIFIALYSLFQNMVELREVPFLWITDLSLPDTVYTLSFSIPFLGNQLNLLPILMTVTALMQSLLPSSPQQSKGKLNSSGSGNAMAESMQKQMNMMKYLFPIMFFFICWNLPSALVFFWTIQNVFSLFQTLYTRRILKM